MSEPTDHEALYAAWRAMEAAGERGYSTLHGLSAKAYPRWDLRDRHRWRSRVVDTAFGPVECRCAWWKRMLYLITGR